MSTYTIGDFPARDIDLMHGRVPLPPPLWESNGCSNAPDGAWALACHFHDWHYTRGGDWLDRLQADAYLFWNVITLAEPYFIQKLHSEKLGKRAARVLARVFYRRVRFWGGTHFEWDDPPRAGTRALGRVVNAVSRYLPVLTPAFWARHGGSAS